jgi:hypothetical protein
MFINQMPMFVFFITLLYVLLKLGLKHFKYYDVYKLIFPVYLVLYLREYRTLLSVSVSAVHISSLILIAISFLY